MGAVEVAQIALSLIGTALGAAKASGLVGSPDWVKYTEAGLFVAKQATDIIGKLTAGASEYDELSPDQIRQKLTPAGWDELEARARAELGIEGALPA